MRVGSLNVGTVTEKGRSFADMMERERLVCCVCKRLDGMGTKRNNWGGCKLLRSGTNEQEWNGVGIVQSKELTEGRPDQCEQEQ